MNIPDESFTQSIYEIVRLIPPGRATSYGSIAKAVGYPNLSRMVGKVMSQSDSAISGIPAHRVVNSQGILTASDAFGAPGEMQRLLEAEGVRIINNRIQNWKHVFWNPIEEIV